MKIYLTIFAVVCSVSISSVCLAQTFYVKENQTVSSSIINDNSFEMLNFDLTEKDNAINHKFFKKSNKHKDKKALSQQNKHCFSANLKIGFFNIFGGFPGVTLGNSLNYKYKKFLMSADFHYYQKIFFTQDYSMVSLYAGTRLGENRIIFDFQCGLGLIWSNDRIYGKKYIMETVLKNSYNLKTGIKFVQRDDFAIGIDMHISISDLNEIYALPLLSIEFGDIR